MVIIWFLKLIVSDYMNSRDSPLQHVITFFNIYKGGKVIEDKNKIITHQIINIIIINEIKLTIYTYIYI